MPNDICAYLGEGKQINTEDLRQVHECKLHGECVLEGDPYPFASCERCKDKWIAGKHPLKRFKDPLLVVDREGNENHSLRGLLADGVAFLVCGGPSAKRLPLEQLEQRGIWSLAINNMAGHFKPSCFVCSDPPSKFHHGIWLDPRIMKLIPRPKLREKRGRLRQKILSKFKDIYREDSRVSTCHCPNVWGFERRAWLKPDDSFFIETSASWGNHNEGVRRTGEKKTVCTMLLGLRLLYYLGARRIYLIGVDFYMDPSADLADNYAFGQHRDKGAIESNNAQFAVVNEWLCKMQSDGVFSRFGVEIYNCNPTSGLRAFAHVPFELAVADALRDFPKEPFDLEGWYEK